MKKLLGLVTILGATATLGACNGLPECQGELDNCNRGGAYTEERTATAPEKVMMEKPAPAPVAQPAPQPAPAPVKVAPAPAPAPEPVIDDTPVMTSAEPQFSTISK